MMLCQSKLYKCCVLFIVSVNVVLGRNSYAAVEVFTTTTTTTTSREIHPFLGLQHLHAIQRSLLDYQNTNIPNRHRSLQRDNAGSASIVIDDTNSENETTETSVKVNDDNETNESQQQSNYDLRTICNVIEQSFTTNVTCTCAGSVIDNFSITCDYLEPICSTNGQTKTCGVIQIAISMVQQQVFSSTTCIQQYTRNSIPLNNTCIFVDTCAAGTTSATRFLNDEQSNNNNKDVELQPSFCSCTAMYGDTICDSCQICSGSVSSMSIDCSNVNAEAISQQCTPIDLDLHLSNDQYSNSTTTNHISGFVPQMDGFCTQLENSMNNSISCDCTNAISGSYNVSCETNDRVCVHTDNEDTSNHCGLVNSTVAVVDGTIDTVTACAAYDTEAFTTKDGSNGKTCTTMHLCDDKTTNENVCSCSATYNDVTCVSCTVVSDGSTLQPALVSDTTYVLLDCSNVHPHAVTDYQPIYASSVYEFLPYYQQMTSAKDNLSFGSDDKTATSNSKSIQLVVKSIAMTIFITTLFLL